MGKDQLQTSNEPLLIYDQEDSRELCSLGAAYAMRSQNED